MESHGTLKCERVSAEGASYLEISAPGRYRARFASLGLCHVPTQLEVLSRLSEVAEGPPLAVKRDDCTGLAGGGNKARKLDLALAPAVEGGFDTLVTYGALQSNHARQTAAAAAKLGLECRLVLEDRVNIASASYRESGNRLLTQLLGGEVADIVSSGTAKEAARNLAEELRRRQRRPYLVPAGASSPLGALAYAACGTEIEWQSRELGIPVDAIFTCVGSGGTLAGLAVATAYWQEPPKLFGVSSGSVGGASVEQVRDLAMAAAKLARLDPQVVRARARLEIVSQMPSYGAVDAEICEAIALAARYEGLILDPVYSGRTFATLLSAIRAGYLKDSKGVVFLHTGGMPAVFAYGSKNLLWDHSFPQEEVAMAVPPPMSI